MRELTVNEAATVSGGDGNFETDDALRDAGAGLLATGGGMIGAGAGLVAVDGPFPFGDTVGIPLAIGGLIVGAAGAIIGGAGLIGGFFDAAVSDSKGRLNLFQTLYIQ
jgi:hypothetical protein